MRIATIGTRGIDRGIVTVTESDSGEVRVSYVCTQPTNPMRGEPRDWGVSDTGFVATVNRFWGCPTWDVCNVDNYRSGKRWKPSR